MNIMDRKFRPDRKVIRYLIALACTLVLLPGNSILIVRAETGTVQQDSVKIPLDQIDSLVAPIALYPDNLLGQTLVASTYPLEIFQLQQWLDRHQDLANDQQKLTEAVKTAVGSKHSGNGGVA
jgi:hypothetical protein